MNKYKSYKDVCPEETINNITNILYKIGVLLKVFPSINENLHCCHVSIGNLGLDMLDISTFGKGKSYAYSVASGYAEFMERLQNRFLCLPRYKNYLHFGSKKFLDTLPQTSKYVRTINKKRLVLDFEYDEREQFWNIDEIIKHWDHELLLLYNYDSQNELKRFITDILNVEESLMIPAYDVFNEKETYIPIQLFSYAVGSNGMCAGNNEIEAILQGICEIFERYVITEIYYNNLTPPTISLEEFCDTTVFEIIKSLTDNNNYEIIIKDCSLGKKIPAIGVVILDKKNMKYKFKIGCDFVPHIALERCFTELYQSQFGFNGLPMDFSWDFDEKYSAISKEKLDSNFRKILINGSGFWPVSILYSNPSYEFLGFDSQLGFTNEYDLHFSINLIKDMGYNMYIRNNSILDFPSYFVIIPGMSQTTKNTQYVECKNPNSSIQRITLLRKLRHLGVDEVLTLAESIESLIDNVPDDASRILSEYILPNKNEDLLSLSNHTDLLLFMLYYYTNSFSKCQHYLEKFLNIYQAGNDPYYKAVSTYITLKHLKNVTDMDIRIVLNYLFGSDIMFEVFEDMSDPKAILKNYHLPTCFDCKECKISETCLIFDLLKIEQKLNFYAVKNRISFKQEIKLNIC